MILVAEDNEINQMVIEHTLLGAGYEFVIVENGKLAVQQFQSIRPDLILMDVSMPEMNGMEATAAIRELELKTGGHVTIVALTAHALHGDREKCIDAGMDDYMSKPISPRILTERLAQWLNAAVAQADRSA
jgi:CheY-like chemotaxis protein